MTTRIGCADGVDRERAVSGALSVIRRGDLVVMPTESVYAVAADAFSRRGVEQLREVKGYDAHAPLPVMVGARGTVDGVAARVPESARALMAAFWPGPLTLLLAPQPTLAWDLPSDVPLAVRMPLHPVALALLLASGPLVVTSANRPGMPAPSDVDDALAQLGERIAVALDAGELLDDTGLPSTVVDASTPVLRIVRTGALAEAEIRRVCPDVLGEGSTSTA